MLKRFVHYYKDHKLMFALDMIASFFIALIGLGYPILTRKLLNDFKSEEDIKSILLVGLALLLIYAIRMLLRYFVQYYGHVIGVNMQAKMRSDLFNKLQKLPYSFYDENESGKIMSRITVDLMDVSELAHHGPENFFICGVSIIGSFIYLAVFVNWMLTLIIFICVPILILISAVLRKRMLNAFKESREGIAKINATIESSITGIRVTKAFNNSEKELEKFETSNNEFKKARSHVFKYMGQFMSTTEFVTDVFNVIVIVAGGLFMIYGKIDSVDFTTFVVSLSLFLNPVNTLIRFIEQLQDGVTGFQRFLEIMDKDEEDLNLDGLVLNDVQGNVILKNVSFNYETSEEILHDVNLNIKAGTTLALVGPSGGGKTTICHIIPAFYRISEGDIYIDNHNLKDINLLSLRENIGIVQQDVFLFNGTIRDNILYGKLNATEEELIEASKNADIYDYVMSLPNKFDTIVGERGIKLSGGQKQRISIARVFLKNPALLILDEATSALDNATEMAIQKSLDCLAKGRTTIVVAHRLSTIKNANEIAYVEDGEVKEVGTHEELLEKKNRYFALYQAQFKGNDHYEI
ncbi:MAG: ABC transporter ATP-binding protein [Erysipelotrichales bacterium]|nr:ABC transporter ATP-binding protein [Erysipelotrichales bacterium]